MEIVLVMMKTLLQKDLPYHTCDTINSQWVDFFLQQWKGKFAKILVLGESPALNGWVLSGRAFYTVDGKLVASGKRFNELFNEFWFGIEDVSFSEICKCILWKERQLLKTCAPKCADHLLKQIKHSKPTLIIILGKHTLEMFEKMYDTTVEFGNIVDVMLGDNTYKIFSIYHPSPIHPKSMEWNKDIVKKNASELRDIL